MGAVPGRRSLPTLLEGGSPSEDSTPASAGGQEGHRGPCCGTGGASYAVREGRYKLLKQGDGAPELYDLQTDTAENLNLAQQLPDVGRRLQKVYESWSAELVPPKWENPRPNKPRKQGADPCPP